MTLKQAICPHKQLKKQMVGEQIWYRCECGQKFRVEPWDGRVRLVEGLKVEEGARERCECLYCKVIRGELRGTNFHATPDGSAVAPKPASAEGSVPQRQECGIYGYPYAGQQGEQEQTIDVREEWAWLNGKLMYRSKIGSLDWSVCECSGGVTIRRAAQHLKREQEQDCPRCGSDSRNIEITCVHCGYLFAAAQPPQESVSLREALEATVCTGCQNRIGWNGDHDGLNARFQRTDWRTCPICRKARAALTRGALDKPI